MVKYPLSFLHDPMKNKKGKQQTCQSHAQTFRIEPPAELRQSQNLNYIKEKHVCCVTKEENILGWR